MKVSTRLAIAAAFIAVVALGFYWQRQRSDSRKRQEAWETLQVEEAIPAAWDQSIAWEKADLKLADFADLVAKKSGLAVELDEAGIAATRSWQAKPREIAVHVPAGEYAPHVLLKMVLPPESLRGDLRGQQVVITALSAAADLARMYPVVYPLPQPLPEGLEEEEWQYLLVPDAEGHVEAVPGAVIVETSALGHRRVRQTIQAICALGEPADKPIEIPPVDEASHARLLAALAEKVKLDPVETQLVDVARFIVDQHRVPVVLNVQRLNEAGVTLDIPITKRLHGISLESALRLVLSDLELTYVLRDGAIVITTPEDAESQLSLVAYPVKDLVEQEAERGLDELTWAITTAIHSQSWANNGGPGESYGINGQWLLVHQTSQTQQTVGRFLDLLRQGLASEEPFAVVHVELAPGNQRIRAALKGTIELDLNNVQLKDAIDLLRKRLGVPVMLNAKKLDEAGVNIDAKIDVPLRSGRVESYLDAMLDPLELVAVVRDEVLLITTPADAESQLEARLYDTRGLLGDAAARERLTEFLSSFYHIAWEESGGVGSFRFFRNVLVVVQTEDFHRPLERLLAELKNFSLADSTREPPLVVSVDAPPEQLAVESILAKIVNVEINNQPLNEAIEGLAQEHGLSVQIDRQGLEAGGYSYPLPPESLKADGVPLGAALDRLLAPRYLDFAVGELGLLIDNRNRDKEETRLYRVDSLARSRWKTFEEFNNELYAQRAKFPEIENWLNASSVAAWDATWLAVRGPTRFHWWIEDWLAELRTGQTPIRERERREIERSKEQWQLDRMGGDPFGPPPPAKGNQSK